jgi:CO/xanthine dehydrogenase FAD-binding subunit
MATIGGDMLSPYNWADIPPILLVLDAKLRFMGARELIVPVERYAEMRKELGLGFMLLTEIIIEREPADRCGVFLKFGRTKSDIGIVTIAATANVEGKKLSNIRLAVAGVTSQAIRLPSAEAVAEGKAVSDDVLEAAATAALQDLTPVSDVRATGEYRAELLQVAVKRALAQLTSQEGSS